MAFIVVKQNIGVGISMKDFSACIYQGTVEGTGRVRAIKKFENRPVGFEKLLKWVDDRMEKSLKISFTMGSRWVYSESLVYFLHAHELDVNVGLPNMSKVISSL